MNELRSFERSRLVLDVTPALNPLQQTVDFCSAKTIVSPLIPCWGSAQVSVFPLAVLFSNALHFRIQAAILSQCPIMSKVSRGVKQFA